MTKKTVMITGCSSGIGKALALECQRQGFNTIATARSLARLGDLQEKGITCMELDVTDKKHIEELAQHFNKNNQVIDFLVNNAGVGLMMPMTDLDEEALHQQFQCNVYGVVNLSNALLPNLLASKRARIINIGSVSGILTTPFAGAYCASKAALHAISEAYRMELAPLGIDVTIVQPGAISSSFGDNASRMTESLLRDDSLYKPIEHAIRRRSRASQERPSSAEAFARSLIKEMQKSKARPVLRIGNGSTLLPLLPKLLKPSILDHILSKPFHLQQLNKHKQQE